MTGRIGTEKVQRSDLPALVELIQLEYQPSQLLYLVSTSFTRQPLRFNDQLYQPASLSLKGVHAAAQTSSATPTLILSEPVAPLQAAIEAGECAGCRVSRIVTFSTELEPPYGDGGGAQFEAENWQVERVLRLDRHQLHLKLVPALYLEKKNLPYRMILRNICQHRYRRWDEVAQAFDYQDVSCPYVGDAYYDAEGHVVSSPLQDRCSLKLHSGCKKRFSDQLPFFGFPGVR